MKHKASTDDETEAKDKEIELMIKSIGWVEDTLKDVTELSARAIARLLSTDIEQSHLKFRANARAETTLKEETELKSRLNTVAETIANEEKEHGERVISRTETTFQEELEFSSRSNLNKELLRKRAETLTEEETELKARTIARSESTNKGEVDFRVITKYEAESLANDEAVLKLRAITREETTAKERLELSRRAFLRLEATIEEEIELIEKANAIANALDQEETTFDIEDIVKRNVPTVADVIDETYVVQPDAITVINVEEATDNLGVVDMIESNLLVGETNKVLTVGMADNNMVLMEPDPLEIKLKGTVVTEKRFLTLEEAKAIAIALRTTSTTEEAYRIGRNNYMKKAKGKEEGNSISRNISMGNTKPKGEGDCIARNDPMVNATVKEKTETVARNIAMRDAKAKEETDCIARNDAAINAKAREEANLISIRNAKAIKEVDRVEREITMRDSKAKVEAEGKAGAVAMKGGPSNSREQVYREEMQRVLAEQRNMYERRTRNLVNQAAETARREAEIVASREARARAEANARAEASARAEAAARAEASARAEAAARAEASARAEAAARAYASARAKLESAARAARLAATARAEATARAVAASTAEASRLQAAAKAETARLSAETAIPQPDRPRAPYQYTRDDLLQIRQPSGPSNLHPKLDATVHSFQFSNDSVQQNAKFSESFVFVNSKVQAAGSRPAPFASKGPNPNRDRSASRNRGKHNEDDLINCPICHNMFTLNIFQCPQGHSACSSCKDRNRPCGKCGQKITNTRNFGVEEFISEKKVPCPHNDVGCQLYIKLADMDSHIKECPFKEQQCPLVAVFGYCPWKGKLNQISSHFDSEHRGNIADVDTEMRVTNLGANHQAVYLVVLGVYNFVFHVKVSDNDQRIYMATQLIGTKMSAAKWSYEVHVYNKSNSRRKYTYSDSCYSSNERVNGILTEGNCAVLPLAYAKTFINNEGLTFKFYIKKNNEFKPRGNFNKAGRGGRGGYKNKNNN